MHNASHYLCICHHYYIFTFKFDSVIVVSARMFLTQPSLTEIIKESFTTNCTYKLIWDATVFKETRKKGLFYTFLFFSQSVEKCWILRENCPKISLDNTHSRIAKMIFLSTYFISFCIHLNTWGWSAKLHFKLFNYISTPNSWARLEKSQRDLVWFGFLRIKVSA